MSTGENWWQSASGRWSCNYRYHPFKFALCLDTITPHCCLNLRYPFPITYKCHVFEANMPFSNPFNCFKICSELSQLQTKFLSSWKMTSESWEGEMLNNMNNLKFEFKVSFEHLIKNVLTQQSSVHRTIFRQSNCWKLINNWQHGGLLKFASICDKPLQWASIPKHPILTNYVTWMLMSAKLPNVKYEVMIVEAPNFFWFLFLLRIIVKFVPL